jgi:hypothetical protein
MRLNGTGDEHFLLSEWGIQKFQVSQAKHILHESQNPAEIAVAWWILFEDMQVIRFQID